jgi:hypothetical protein
MRPIAGLSMPLLGVVLAAISHLFLSNATKG